MKLKQIIKKWGVLLTLSLSLFTGCGTKDIIQPVQNDRLQSNSLYVNSFKNISNKSSGYSFELNSYTPQGYNTNTSEIKGIFPTSSIAFADQMPNKYEINECSGKPLNVFGQIVGSTVATLGIGLLAGGMCKRQHTFDYEEFDKDAKEWIIDNNIDRKGIIKKYDSLLSLKQSSELNIIHASKEKTSILNTLYSQYSTEYSKHPSINIKYYDKSQLYKNEALSSKVTFIENALHQEKISDNANYQRIINDSFPCTSTNECITQMDTAINLLKNENISDMNALHEHSKKIISKYEKGLQEKTKTLTTKYSKYLQSDTFNGKTLYYNLLTKDSISSKSKKLDVTYEITHVDYTDVYPLYKNQNKELSISLNPKSQVITYLNLTEKYIQIKSVDLYYNNAIFRLNDSNKATYSTELSPDSFANLKLSQYIDKSKFENITKKKALAKQVKFGFSVKYTIGDSTKNKTLYKQHKMSLYSLIKNR
jgi:hypothetical protein